MGGKYRYKRGGMRDGEAKGQALLLEQGVRGHSDMWIHLERQTEDKYKVWNWKNKRETAVNHQRIGQGFKTGVLLQR